MEGTFATADIGTINRTGTTTVFIEGILDNTGDTLALDNSTGTYTLRGGTIQAGDITLSDSALLAFASNNNNILDGVAVQGDLTLSDSGARAVLRNGTSFTGVANLTGSSAAFIYQQTGVVNNTFNLDGNSADLVVDGDNTLTLGSSAQVNLNASSSEIRSDFLVGGTGTVVNQGTITADGTNGGTQFIDPDIFTNEGTVRGD